MCIARSNNLGSDCARSVIAMVESHGRTLKVRLRRLTGERLDRATVFLSAMTCKLRAVGTALERRLWSRVECGSSPVRAFFGLTMNCIKPARLASRIKQGAGWMEAFDLRPTAVVMSWSGGKDSALALHELQARSASTRWWR